MPEILENNIPFPKSLHPHLDWWLSDSNVLRGQPLHPLQHALQVFTDASNEGFGHTLRGLCKRHLVKHKKSPSHQFSGVKGDLSGPQEFQASLQEPDCVNSNGQHNCGCLHQQGGRYESRFSLCRTLVTSGLVPSQGNSYEGSTHSRSLECDSGQIVQTQTSDPDRVVPISTGV